MYPSNVDRFHLLSESIRIEQIFAKQNHNLTTMLFSTYYNRTLKDHGFIFLTLFSDDKNPDFFEIQHYFETREKSFPSIYQNSI